MFPAKNRNIILGVVLICLSTILWMGGWSSFSSQLSSLKNTSTAIVSSNTGSWLLSSTALREHTSDPSIPNIVHYVWVLKPNSALEFQFKHFISVYSAFLYLKPDTIYIHTNASSDIISEAKETGNYWTRKILQLPAVTYRHMTMPTHTNRGVRLEALEHISDFARPGIMRDYGGIYLDFDVVPIRDMKALRESGFNNVFGHELNEKVNNGVMLSKKGSRFMDIYDREQHVVFDGGWITHSVELLTTMANALTRLEREVLILERKAFNPDGWHPDYHAALFRSHEPISNSQEVLKDESPNAVGEGLGTVDIENTWSTMKNQTKEEWEINYMMGYVIHASSPHIEPPTADCGDIKWNYVMARRSNYARQVYPAMLHAVKTGVISADEKEHV